MQKMFSVLC